MNPTPFLPGITEPFEDAPLMPSHDNITCYQLTRLPEECSKLVFWSIIKFSFNYFLTQHLND